MKSYLTYAEYKEYGGLLDESAFSSYLFDVESKLNYITGNRIKQLDEIPEQVKRLEFKLIKLYQTLNGSNSNEAGLIQTQTVSSYSNGIETFSYSSPNNGSSTGSTSMDSILYATIREYLVDYPELLYRGRKQWKHQ